MKLFEYMSKELFKKYSIPVPKGRVFTDSEGIKDYADGLKDVVIKSQVLSGGRGKAGGVKFTASAEEAEKIAKELLASKVRGCAVEAVLVEEKLQVEKEIYLAITIDGAAKKPVIIASANGGINIEEAPENCLIKMFVDIHAGVQPYLARELARQINLTPEYFNQFADLLVKMYCLFREYDCELVEINPLVVSGDQLIAADAKITVDDDAAFRYPDDLPLVEERNEREKSAYMLGISYVELDGEIGVIANGAGITMATLDIINHYGGNPRNFMDAGGGANIEATAKALKILLSTKPKAILGNFFGGITRCDDVANAFAQVKRELGFDVPLVIRLVGTNEQAGIEILEKQGISSFRTIDEAVAKVVELAYTGEGSSR